MPSHVRAIREVTGQWPLRYRRVTTHRAGWPVNRSINAYGLIVSKTTAKAA
jgi:hypothetical protein